MSALVEDGLVEMLLPGRIRSGLQRQVRERLGVEDLEIGDAEFEGLREESPGREISL